MQDSKRDTDDIKNRLLDSVGEGKGGMVWENSIETCILPYVKEMTSPSSMPETFPSDAVTFLVYGIYFRKMFPKYSLAH